LEGIIWSYNIPGKPANCSCLIYMLGLIATGQRVVVRDPAVAGCVHWIMGSKNQWALNPIIRREIPRDYCSVPYTVDCRDVRGNLMLDQKVMVNINNTIQSRFISRQVSGGKFLHLCWVFFFFLFHSITLSVI
jgi:hypothetical protein